MKLLLLLGGLVGFATGLVFSWAQASSGPTALWHACVAAYVTSMLMRWWGRAWQRGLQESLMERQAAKALEKSPAATSGGKA